MKSYTLVMTNKIHFQAAKFYPGYYSEANLKLSLSLSPLLCFYCFLNPPPPSPSLGGVNKKKINPEKLPVSSVPPRSGRQGPAELLITRTYGGISVSHLLPASWGIKG